MEALTGTFLGLILIAMGISLLAMIIVPVLPGQIGIWTAATVYGLVVGWDRLGWPVFLLLTLLTLTALIIDQIAGWWGAKRGGATFKGIIAGAVAGLVGMIFLNAIGAILGFVLGLMGYEYYQRRDWAEAWRAAKGYLLGQLISLVVRLGIAVSMIFIFWMRVS